MVARGVGTFRPDLIAWRPGYMHSLAPGGCGLGPLVPITAAPPTRAQTIKDLEQAALDRCVRKAAAAYTLHPGALWRPGNVVAVKRARALAAHLMSLEPDTYGKGLFSAAGIANLLKFESPEQVLRAINSLGLDWGKA